MEKSGFLQSSEETSQESRTGALTVEKGSAKEKRNPGKERGRDSTGRPCLTRKRERLRDD